MAILTPQPWFRDLLMSLKPGVRGWDLPSDAAVLSYNPNPDRLARLGRATPPESCAVRDIWAMGTSCAAPEVVDYLKGFGISLGWEPGNLRFVAKSPDPADENAPLLLLRLVRGTAAVGIQKIRLDTGERQSLAFANCEVDNAVGAMWKPKPHVFVAPTLEDAMAMSAQWKKPCIVAPTPKALAELEWPEGATTITALLPSADSATWIAAMTVLRAREQPHHVWLTQVFPLERSSCPGFLYPAEWAWQCKQQARSSR